MAVIGRHSTPALRRLIRDAIKAAPPEKTTQELANENDTTTWFIRKVKRQMELGDEAWFEDAQAAQPPKEEAIEAATENQKDRRITQLEIEIARRVGEHETLYGSVTSADIAHALESKGFEVDKRKIQLPEPIKTLGETTVPIRIHRDVAAQLRVKVVPDTH